jgi:hypothetical protein
MNPTQNKKEMKKKNPTSWLKKEQPSINFLVLVPHAQLLRRQRWTGPV